MATYPSKKAKKLAKYRQRAMKRKHKRDEQIEIERIQSEGIMGKITKLIGIKSR